MPRRADLTFLAGNITWLIVLLLSVAGCKHEPQLEPKVPVGGEDPSPTTCDPATVYFQQQIQPILISNCAMPGCHSGPEPANGLDLTSYQGMFDQDVVRPFDLDRDLFEAITEDDPDKIMPPLPQAPLSQDQIDLIALWIMQGAQNNSCVSSGCDTLSVTYSGTIVPLVQQRCQGCHSGGTPQAGLNLTSYTVMNAIAIDGRLEAVITHDPLYAPMPPSSPRMPDCEIRKYLIWVEAGAPNN